MTSQVVADSVYTPAQVAAYGIQRIKDQRENRERSIGMGIPIIQDYFMPVMPGEIAGVIAQTHNYKSGFLHHVTTAAANQLSSRGSEDVIVHISTEEIIEQQAFYQFSRETGVPISDMVMGNVDDWGKIISASAKIAQTPIYRIGTSFAKSDMSDDDLTLSNMLRGVKYLRDTVLGRKVGIAMLVFDYLQAFPYDPEGRKAGDSSEQRRLQVRRDVYRLRKAASYFQCPVWVAIQARQELRGAPGPNMLIPGVYDGEESSSIAQRFDCLVQLWMPKQTHTVGSTLRHGGFSFEVRENDVWIKVGKQRGGLPSGRSWLCEIDFRRNTIRPREGQ